MYLKISDMRLVNITILKEGKKIYKGKVEDAPEEIKKCNYKSINFDGVDVLVEI